MASTSADDGPEPAGLLEQMAGRRFGDYELLAEIARGGMGVVYRARQLSLRREVALKTILAGEFAGAVERRMFQTEALAAAALHHPNIVAVYDCGEFEALPYLAMHYVPGERNIAHWAAEQRTAGAWRALAAAMAQVARAVAHAHERGVLHRDLKPSNILWEAGHGPQITDFGLARLLTADGGLTASAHMIGSPGYMAPEQTGGRAGEITTATDVYGLGAVLYELCSGRPPFQGKSTVDTVRRVAEEAPAPLPGTPKDLRTVCLKCLAKRQADRYASASALAEDLERFTRGEPVSAVPLTPWQTAWRWALRKPALASLLALLVVSLLAGVIGVVWQWREAERANAAQATALEHLRWKEIARQAGTSEAPIALAQLAALLRDNPDNWKAAMLAMSVVDQRAFPVLAGPPVLPDSKPVTPPRLAPDGGWFAAACRDQAVRVWETATGRERVRIALTSPATALAAGDGAVVLATATMDAKLSVWPSFDGSATALARAGTRSIDDLHFSADGTRLAARSPDGVEVWNCRALQEPPRMFTLDGGIRGAAISAAGTRLLAWNANRAAVWDTATGQTVLNVIAQANFTRGAIAAGGARVVLLDGQFAARTWDLETGALLSTVESSLTSFRLAALDTGGARLTLGGAANALTVHDTASGLPVSPPMPHLYEPIELAASPDGTRTVSYGWDGRASVWDAATGQTLVSPVWINSDAKAAAVETSRDGRLVLLFPESVRDGQPAISVWHPTRTVPALRQRVEGQRNFGGARLSPDGRLGCLGLTPDHRCYLYEPATGRVVLDAPTNGEVYIHLFSPDLRKCYALTANGWLHGWSLESGATLWPAQQQPGAVRPGEISPDGTRIIAGHNDGHIRIYDTATGRQVKALDHPGEIKVLRFAPGGSGRFLSASTDHLAHVWDLKTGEKQCTFTGHEHTILAGAWSPDGRYIATASYDQTARVWDAATGSAAGRPMTHLAWLSHLEFSPDGRLLATACRDGTVRLWHPLTGEPASPPLPQASTVLTVRFTQDGAAFLVRDHLGFQFWSTESAEPVTVHYPAPLSSGLGMDSESWRDILTPDGTRVFLGASMSEGFLQTVAQPRTRVPAWFPDLLECLALVQLDAAGTARISSGERLFKLSGQVVNDAGNSAYSLWARRVLGRE